MRHAARDGGARIESISQQDRSFIVSSMTIYADRNTDYDDLKSFSDLKIGQRAEVNYMIRNGKYLAKEIGLDD